MTAADSPRAAARPLPPGDRRRPSRRRAARDPLRHRSWRDAPPIHLHPRRSTRLRERSARSRPRTDVYCGVLLRSHRAGGRDAVTRSHLAFVEIDAVDALDAARAIRQDADHDRELRDLRARARLLALFAPRRSDELEQANRTLASHLGGDLGKRRRRADPSARRHPLAQASTAGPGRAAAPRTRPPSTSSPSSSTA